LKNKRTNYKFNKSRVRDGIKISNREDIRRLIADRVKKKIDILKQKDPTGYGLFNGKEKIEEQIQGQKEVVSSTGTVQIVQEPVTEEEKEESRKRLLSRFLGDGTHVLYDRVKTDIEEAVIHSAGVYTEPRNIVTDKSYDELQLQKLFGEDWRDISDDFENVYDENTLLRFHDTLRVDGDVNKAFLKSNKFVIGTDYPHIVTDCNRSYPSEEAESYELKRINNNFVYWSIKNELQRIDKNVNSYHAMHTQLYQTRGYQRGVILIEHDENGIPIALKPLSALRCGRILVNRRTWRPVGIEYYDFARPNNIILFEDIIYMTNRDYAQSVASMLYGYSDIEFVSHLVELNLIINSIVLKEINRTQWAPYVFIQLQDTEDEAQAIDFMNKAKRGLSIASLLPFKVDAIPPTHSGAFVVEQRAKNSRAIISHTGMLNDLVNDEESATHANLSTKLQSYNQTDVKFFRLCIRQVWEQQWYGRNIMAIIRRRYNRLKAQGVGETAKTPVDEILAQAKPTPGDITIREAANLQEEDENDLIIEDERRIWEINRKLQISKVKSLVEKEIQDNGLQLDQTERDQIMKDIGIADLEKAKPNNTTYSQGTEDAEPYDLTSEIGLDLISPATKEYELKVLEELMQYTDYTRLPFKVKILFPNVSFDTDIEKSLATIGEFQAEIIPKERAQENTDNEDLVQQTREETQIKLFMAKALAPAIQQAQEKANQLEIAAAEAGMRGKVAMKPPGKKPGDNVSGNSNSNQIDLKNRINPMTKLRKKAGIQNYTPG
jgi:hypothetical protein